MRRVKLPGGIYTDGKRAPTLVRQTAQTKVRVPGGSNKIVIEDHYPVLAEPGGQYNTHVTPEEGSGLALARKLAAVILERESKIRYISCVTVSC